jgi:hypothetical protein
MGYLSPCKRKQLDTLMNTQEVGFYSPFTHNSCTKTKNDIRNNLAGLTQTSKKQQNLHHK